MRATLPVAPRIVGVAMALLLAACLVRAAVATVIVPGTTTLMVINPPQLTTCARRGWTFFYVPSGTAYRAHSAVYLPTAQLLDVTPAWDGCIHIDSFEEI